MAECRYNLRGDVDLAAAPQVRSDLQCLVSGTDAHLLIDCSQLTFIDSTGVTVLLEAHAELKKVGRELLVTNVPARCRKVFAVLGLEDLMRYDGRYLRAV